MLLFFYFRWAETHHRCRYHKEGHPASLWHVSVPTHEPTTRLRVLGGLLGDHVPSVQIPWALCEAALPFTSDPQVQSETQRLLAQEVTGKDHGIRTRADWTRRDLRAEVLGVDVNIEVCVCVCVCCPHSPFTHFCQWKHFISTRSEPKDEQPYSLCDRLERKHKPYNLHQDWTWQSFLLVSVLPPPPSFLFGTFCCCCCCFELYLYPANAALSWSRLRTDDRSSYCFKLQDSV